MTILVTGAAGFIGFNVARTLLRQDEDVIGVDNLNDYYDVRLKKARLKELGPDFRFYEADISDRDVMQKIWDQHEEIDQVVHLAAQAGVRYSLQNPFAYVQSNITGHLVMLELCRARKGFKHFVYASSSSVYGGNKKAPFSTEDRTDTPISLYGATKKADELMSQAYAHLFGFPTTGLRFFTVYGPWGRPDMAAYIFTENILAGKPIKVFNHGKMKRDFTYIDDIVAGTLAALKNPTFTEMGTPCNKVYNLGNNHTQELMRYIELIEETLGKKANIEMMPLQAGDVAETYADITDAQNTLGFNPQTGIDVGIPNFVNWYLAFQQAHRTAA